MQGDKDDISINGKTYYADEVFGTPNTLKEKLRNVPNAARKSFEQQFSPRND